MSDHDQIQVHLDEMVIEVDAGIGPFVELLYRNGIDMVNGCEDAGEERMAITFDRAADAERFLDLVGRSSQQVYNQIAGLVSDPDDEGWEACAAVSDMNFGGLRPKFELRPVLYFPASDLGAILAALEEN
jgi:hypothetical protein